MTITSNKSQQATRWKLRTGPAGVHVFDRSSGLNVLIDELPLPSSLYSKAPRHVSIALTNRCDLSCSHCYAPKSTADIPFNLITRWLSELDSHGTLGVSFGGGEPTLYPRFADLCRHVAHETRLSVSFTTHGHNIDDFLSDSLRGSVHFIRVSMDGVGATYESIRQRPFSALLSRLPYIQSISRFGINVVINDRTLPELSDVATIAATSGACELLLLPQISARGVNAISASAIQGLRHWVDAYGGPLKLCINETSADGFPTCDPLAEEQGIRAYAHIDALGILKPSSYVDTGVRLNGVTVIDALDALTNDRLEGFT